MSPEQAKGQEVDERTDIFSLGAVIYEMLAGKAPFAGDSMPETFANLINTEPQPLSHFAANVPDELQRIVTKALRKNQDQRYQTMKDLMTDLRDLRESLTLDGKLVRSLSTNANVATSPPENLAGARPTSSAEYLFKEIREHKRVGWLILTAVVATTIIAAYFVTARNFTRGNKVASSEANIIRSIAVLPLTNVSHNPDTDYLSDGVSESLINSLSQLPGMSVIARNSSFKFRGKESESEEIAKTLDVDGILTGRVLQRGDNLVISVELMDARTKVQVWGETYNRRATDVLQVQSEISREIIEKLRLRLTLGEQQQLSKLNTAKPEAYELLLKGRFSQSKGSTEDRKKAIEFFQQAIALDSAYALAYAELARSYLGLVNNNIADQREFVPKAEAAARKAVELDDNLAEAHQAMAGVKVAQWDWTAAEREFKRAIELNPNLVGAHIAYAYFLRIQRRDEENAVEWKRAKELDPLAPGINGVILFELLSAGKNDQAIEAAKKMVELDQNNPGLHMLLGGTYSSVGRFPEAIAAIQEGIKLGDTSPDAQIYLAIAYANNGEHDKARGILNRLETGKEYVSPMGLAAIYAAVGEKDQAFALLEKAYSAHDQQLIWLGGPELAPLRSDPRFRDLVRRVGVAMP
jgi:eukaryotic-like serine/threonine-protein kinase